jgi:hypothetical protein
MFMKSTPDFPIETNEATGQLLGKRPIICGGEENECQCQTFENGVWSLTPNPTQCRTEASSTILTNTEGNDVLFIAGVNFNNILRLFFCTKVFLGSFF